MESKVSGAMRPGVWNMLPYWTAPLAAALGNLLIGLGVLWTAQPQRLHRVFALLTATLCLWNLDVFSLYFFEREADALWWSRVFRPGMFIAPAALYHFVATFRARRGPLMTSLVGLGYLAGAVFIAADFQGYMIAGLRRLYSGYWPVMRPPYNAFIAVLLLSFLVFLASLVDEYQTTRSPRRRVQAKFWLLGAVIALPLAAINLLPFFDIDVYPVGSLGNLVCTGIFAYAIVHHRLVDTDVVITKAVAFLAGIVLVIVPLSAFAAWLDNSAFGHIDYNRALLGVAILLVAAVAFPRITGATEQQLSQTFFREKIEHRQGLAAFSRQAARIMDPWELVCQLGETIRTGMGVDATTVLLSEDHGATFAPFNDVTDNGVRLGAENPLGGALRDCDDVLVREELVLQDAAGVPAAGALEALGYEVAVPLRAKGNVLGCLLIGVKTTGDAFSREDLQLLGALANATAIALDNQRLATELRASRQMVARASRLSAVGTLAAGIAHEIRNPLVAVQTFLQLLPERLQDAEFVQSFRRLSLSEIARIGRLIEELLHLSQSPVHAAEPCDLRALVADLVTLLSPQARRSHVTLQLSGGDAPVLALVDAGRIKQVLMNLVLNAVQASPSESQVGISVRSAVRANGASVCRVEVVDQGIGIPPERHDDVFTPFFTTKDSGTGLGLAVAHQIVTEHGGEITFTSAPGAGTTFVVTLPAEAPGSRVSAGEGSAHKVGGRDGERDIGSAA